MTLPSSLAIARSRLAVLPERDKTSFFASLIAVPVFAILGLNPESNYPFSHWGLVDKVIYGVCLLILINTLWSLFKPVKLASSPEIQSLDDTGLSTLVDKLRDLDQPDRFTDALITCTLDSQQYRMADEAQPAGHVHQFCHGFDGYTTVFSEKLTASYDAAIVLIRRFFPTSRIEVSEGPTCWCCLKAYEGDNLVLRQTATGANVPLAMLKALVAALIRRKAMEKAG
jgi:hypothetical protein